MREKIYNLLGQLNILKDYTGIVVGLSGGADSVCLLLVLKDIVDTYCLNVRLVAVHVNHMIRGQEAIRDQEFARELSNRLGVEFCLRTVDVPAFARENGLSLEDAARQLRYAALREVAGDKYAIAVAHHMNDQAETVLMHMLRGAGLNGLSGMKPRRDNIVRPLLYTTRAEIENYLMEKGQTFVVDSTNADTEYSRNRIRNVVIPYIQENFNENIIESICNLAGDVADLQSLLDSHCEPYLMTCKRVNEGIEFPYDDTFLEEMDTVKGQVIYRLLREVSPTGKDIYRVHVSQVLSLLTLQVGKKCNMPGDIIVERTYDGIKIFCLSKAQSEQKKYPVTAGCSINEEDRRRLEAGEELHFSTYGYIQGTFADNNLQELEISLKVVPMDIKYDYKKPIFDRNIYTEYFDYDTIKDDALELSYRAVQEQDYMIINENQERKSIKKLFKDLKVPADKRNNVLLLTMGNEVLWGIGLRRANAFYVKADTKKVLMVKVTVSGC